SDLPHANMTNAGTNMPAARRMRPMLMPRVMPRHAVARVIVCSSLALVGAGLAACPDAAVREPAPPPSAPSSDPDAGGTSDTAPGPAPDGPPTGACLVRDQWWPSGTRIPKIDGCNSGLCEDGRITQMTLLDCTLRIIVHVR